MSRWTRKSRLSKWHKNEIKRQLWDQSQKCALCGKQLPGIYRSTLDHIKPLSKGGSDHISNLQLTHWKCNNERGDKEI